MLDTLNFVLTNRLPRLAASRLAGKLSGIEHPLWAKPALWLWARFGGLDFSATPHTGFKSIKDCFTRPLLPGARPVASHALGVSPCDGIVGAHGRVDQGRMFQVKGLDYALNDLVIDPALAQGLAGHQYMTIRITASMYHRLHAPCAGMVNTVHYIHGDTWNVNPPALARVPGLFCRNERAVMDCTSAHGEQVVMVPVAAILVAGIRLHCTGLLFEQGYRGPARWSVNTPMQCGEELGWFEHGSTVVLLVPGHWRLHESIAVGSRLHMGQALWV
ncbi:MAG: archaetidylserine decarboxylase [Limnobacter sp.]|uniref:archaetidylserine decarboxylase n=1 Tax=Limnobacter sp. TaxID=2003368 RepID=UPI00391AB1D7